MIEVAAIPLSVRERPLAVLPHSVRRIDALLISLALAATLSACSSAPPPAYRSETFAIDSPFVTWTTREPEAACEIGRRALLSQGYQVDSSKPTRIHGEKLFQPKPDHGMTLTITLVCLPSAVGTAMYANAQQTRYELKSAATNTGLSVVGVGSISLPWTSDKQAMIKVGEETITEADFYHRLFSLIQTLQGG
jgi:hypothetical protein